jgi:hypothetical protein
MTVATEQEAAMSDRSSDFSYDLASSLRFPKAVIFALIVGIGAYVAVNDKGLTRAPEEVVRVYVPISPTGVQRSVSRCERDEMKACRLASNAAAARSK